tara:strand:+ start:13652 stop:14410 length:759 start_codon:yes stop_codon:yes gene_type:complete
MIELGTDFFIVASIMVFFIGVSKAGLAAGFGALGVPIFSLYMPPAMAAGILLPIMVVIDTTNLWNYRNHFQRQYLKILILGALVGIGFGTMAFGVVRPEWLRVGVGVIALWFSALYFFRSYLPRISGKMPIKYGFFFAIVSGFTSHLAHAGGPPVRAFLLNQDLPKSQFIGTFGFLFATINWMKMPPYLYFGQITRETMYLSLILSAAVPFGVLVGLAVHKSLSQALFTKIAYILLTFAGLRMIYDGFSQIL